MKRRVCVVGRRAVRRSGDARHERASCSRRSRSGARSTTPGSSRPTSRAWRAPATAGCTRCMLAEYLGLTPRWLESSSIGGSSFEFHTMHAFRAIEAGDVDTVAIVYGNNQLSASGRTLGTGGGGGGRAAWRCRCRWPTSSRPGSRSWAPTRWRRSGTCTSSARPPEQLASISVQTREHAARNPNAMYRDPITVDDVLSSRLVADPLHKLDCCVISDGGCCIILTTEERARDLAHRPVYVRGAAGGTTHHSIQAMADMTRTAGRGERPEGVRRSRDHAGRRRHVRDVRLVHLHGARDARRSRLRAEGRGRRVRDRRRRQPAARRRAADQHRRRRPVGDASRACAACSCSCEATRQLRGEAGDSQVPGAEIAVAHGSGGWLSTQATVVLGTEPT